MVTNVGTADLTVTTMTFSGSDPAAFSHDAVVPLVLVPGQSSTTTITFSPGIEQLFSASFDITSDGGTEVVTLTGEGMQATMPIFANPVQSISYTYDAVGNILTIVDTSDTATAKTLDFIYDDLYRLTSASSTGATSTSPGDYLRTYTYNAIGNITNKSDQGAYTYEGNTGSRYENPHAVTDIAGTDLTYDNNGNLTNDSTWTHTWDYNNRLVSSVIPAQAGIQYGYDHTGQRTTLDNGTTTTIYANTYYNTNGNKETKHIYLPTGASAATGANNQLVATLEVENSTTTIQYIHTDHLLGSNAITNEDGYTIQVLDYYPFGDLRIDEQYIDFNEQRKFTGHMYDDDTGLTYANARYYPAQYGRWLSLDPMHLRLGSNQLDTSLVRNGYSVKYPLLFINLESHNSNEIESIGSDKNNLLFHDYLSQPQRLNSYSYVSNNPLVHVDPSGESENAEKMVNYFSGRGWHSDAELIDLASIPTTISSPEALSQTYLSSPEAAPNATLQATGPNRPSFDQRKRISDGINSVSQAVDAIGEAASTPGLGASITLTSAGIASVAGPEAGAAVLVAYPVIELSVQGTALISDLASNVLNRAASWFINP